MEQKNHEEIHRNLTNNLKKYVKAIISKYGEYIPKDRLSILNSITEYENIIKIYDYGSVNAYANSEQISMPLCAEKLLNTASKIPGYGINKKHKSYNEDNLIDNNNTYINYIIHAFIAGTNAEGYYDDMLLHETMHFCGSGGGTALKEGINELLTRKLALEKGFRTNGCGYPKEVQVAFKLQNIFGEEILDQIAFINSESQIYLFLANELGIEASNLYMTVSNMMEKEFKEKYYSNLDSYNGITGIIRKTINYKKIDYSNIYSEINKYVSTEQIEERHGIKK